MLIPRFNQITPEALAAIATWLIVSGMAVLRVEQRVVDAPLVAVTLLLLAFIAGFIYATSVEAINKTQRRWLVLWQMMCIVVLYLLLPLSFLPILSTIWAAQLPRSFSYRDSVVLAILSGVPLYLIFGLYWQGSATAAIFQTLVYILFSLFAVVTMDRAVREETGQRKGR